MIVVSARVLLSESPRKLSFLSVSDRMVDVVVVKGEEELKKVPSVATSAGARLVGLN